jgi:Na+/melibiose symporter-like transporter
MLALFLNSFAGYYLEYFWRSARFDRYLHAYSVFSYALLFYFIIMRLTDSGGTKLFHALFIVFLGISLGTLFEISEFRTDSKRNTRMQKGLKDTNFDIIFDIAGASAAGLFAYFAIL